MTRSRMFNVATKTLNTPANSINAPGIGLSASAVLNTPLVENTRMNTPNAPIPKLIRIPEHPDVQKTVQNHRADQGEEQSGHQSSGRRKRPFRRHHICRNAHEHKCRNQKRGKNQTGCDQARHPQQRRNGDARHKPVCHQSRHAQHRVMPDGNRDAGNDVQQKNSNNPPAPAGKEPCKRFGGGSDVSAG